MCILNAGDLKFFSEYKDVMNIKIPIAASLDFLQGEEKAYMGILPPTIASVLNALESKRLMDMDYCRPLLDNLIDSVQTRYDFSANLICLRYTSLGNISKYNMQAFYFQC